MARPAAAAAWGGHGAPAAAALLTLTLTPTLPLTSTPTPTPTLTPNQVRPPQLRISLLRGEELLATCETHISTAPQGEPSRCSNPPSGGCNPVQ